MEIRRIINRDSKAFNSRPYLGGPLDLIDGNNTHLSRYRLSVSTNGQQQTVRQADYFEHHH